MTIIYWPNDLPQYVLRDQFQHSPSDGRQVDAMDRGPPKQRPLGSSSVEIVPCQIQVDLDGRARFDRFWLEDIRKVKPFLIRDQLRDGFKLADEASVLLTDETDAPLLIDAWWLVQIDKTTPVVTPAGGLLFNIAFTLNVLP